MKFEEGKQPKWKGKPKASPLDTDTDFVKLRNMILRGEIPTPDGAGMLVYDADSTRLGKNPARTVRDHVRRILKRANLETHYRITCRQTAVPGELGVWVIPTSS